LPLPSFAQALGWNPGKRMNRNALKFGVHYPLPLSDHAAGPVAQLSQSLLSQMAELDDLGYDYVWVTEFPLTRGGRGVPDLPTWMAAIAGATKKIRLGVALDILSLHNPIETAESYAMVDITSDGRLEFGLGTDNELDDYEKVGVNLEESARRMHEATEVVVHAWSEQTVNFRGEFFAYQNVPIKSKPLQRPRPPIWVGCAQSEETFRWAGVKGFQLMTLPYLYREPRLLSGLVRTYRRALGRAGHDFTATEVLGRFRIYVSHGFRQALREAGPYLSNDFAASDAVHLRSESRENLKIEDLNDQVARGFAIFGDPERCIDSIQRWREEAGLTTFSFAFHFGGMPDEMAMTSLRLFAERVMPQFK